jgi:L-2,4-diaminobutyrate decarboxylase
MHPIIREAYDAEIFRREGHLLVDLLADYLHGVAATDQWPALAWQSPEAAFDYWNGMWQQSDGDLQQLFKETLARSIHLHHPHYMGHQINPPAPAAFMASMLVDALNNGMGVFEMGMAGTAIERVVIKTTANAMGLGDNADGFLTSGGTLANLTALLAARSAKAPEGVWEEGARSRLALLVSEESHYCIDRAARIMGWGDAGVIKVPADEQYAMRTDLLEDYYQKAQAEGLTVIAVVGSACATSTGSFDNLEAIGEFCRKNNLWFHVDGAHGGALAFSDAYRHLLKGIQSADSVAMDFHKMLLAPAITTALIFSDGNNGYHTFHQRAQYLWADAEQVEWYNLAKRTFECTKQMMSLKVFAVMYSHGLELWDAYVTQMCDLGKTMADLVTQRADFELAVTPQCNIVCFRYVPPGVAPESLNALNQAIRQQIIEKGDFYIVQTILRGNAYLRVTLANPFTSKEDLETLLNEVVKSYSRIVSKS